MKQEQHHIPLTEGNRFMPPIIGSLSMPLQNPPDISISAAMNLYDPNLHVSTQLTGSFAAINQNSGSPTPHLCPSPDSSPHSNMTEEHLINTVHEETNNSSTFVHKLFRMVNDEEYQHLICWGGSGNSFVVKNVSIFSKDMLPKYFRHNNFRSFVRQLNFYGFQKVNKSVQNASGMTLLETSETREFFHPYFLFNRPDLLDQIKRKKDNEVNKNTEPDDMVVTVSILRQKNVQLMSSVQQLEQKLEFIIKDLYRQREVCQTLQQLVGVQNLENSNLGSYSDVDVHFPLEML